MRILIIVLAWACLHVACAFATAKPNIVLIVADDLGYADLGCQQQSTDVKTPHIDSIAANGVRFTNGYVSAPVCSPARAGLLTGRYQQRFGHEFNPGGPNDPAEVGLPLSETLLPQHLKKQGYATGMVGKWHLGNREGYLPNDRGFDSFFGFHGGGHSYVKLAPGGKNSIMRDRKPVDEKEYLTDAFSREAAAFIEANHDKPFFLYVAYNAIHTPLEEPGKYIDRFENVSDSKRRIALAMLSAMDDGVGRILDQLRAQKLEENTLVIFLSDNGGPTHGNTSRNDPLSGYKGQVWEGGIRIPFMMQWKGRVEPRVIDHPVIALDVFATASALADAPTPENVDGVNLLPLLTGETSAPPHETLYWRFAPQRAIRHQNHKLVQFGQTPVQLFDLSSDPGEKNNIASANPQLVAQLEEKYAAWNKTLAEPLWKTKEKFELGSETDAAQLSPKEGRQRRQRN